MVLNATSGSYKNINSSSKLASLAIDVDSSVNSKHVVFVRTVFEKFKLFTNLNSKLTGWSKDHGEGLTASEKFFSAEHFNHW